MTMMNSSPRTVSLARRAKRMMTVLPCGCGSTCQSPLLVRYLNQGRADAERTPPSPRRLVSWLMTRPDRLPAHHRGHLQDLLAACPHLTLLRQPSSPG
jgi:hypothetical protein